MAKYAALIFVALFFGAPGVIGAIFLCWYFWLMTLDPVIRAYRNWRYRRYVRRVDPKVAEEFLRRNDENISRDPDLVEAVSVAEKYAGKQGVVAVSGGQIEMPVSGFIKIMKDLRRGETL